MFHGFLARCVLLTLLLALFSVALSSGACYYSMIREQRNQEDKSMHIAAATARQRMDDQLSRFQIVLDRVATSSAYQALLKDNYTSEYEKTYHILRLGNNLEPYLSKLGGVDLLLTTFPELCAVTQLEQAEDVALSITADHHPEELFPYLSTAEAPEYLFCLQDFHWKGRQRLAITAMRLEEDTPVYFTLLLNDDFWATLTGGDFQVSLADGTGATYFPYEASPLGDASCTEEMEHAGWQLTAVYSYRPAPRLFQPGMLLIFLLMWLPLCGGAVYCVMSRRLQELHDMGTAMEARLEGKQEFIRPSPKKHRMRLSILLLLLLTLTSLGSVVFSTVFFYHSYADVNRQQISTVYARAAKQLSSYLNSLLSSYRQALENIAVTPAVQELFQQTSITQTSAALWQLQQELGFVPPEYGNLTMYSLDGRLLASTIYNADYLNAMPTYHIMDNVDLLHTRQMWQYRQGEWGSIRLGILAAGASSHLPSYGEKLGMIWLDFDDSSVNRMMNDLAAEDCFCALYDRQGNLLLCTDRSDAPLTLAEAASTQAYFTIQDDVLSANGWHVRLFVSNNAITVQQQRVWVWVSTMMSAVLLVLFIVCIMIERNLLSAIRTLMGCMRAVPKDQRIRYAEEPSHPDEIKRLGTQFNRMLQSLDEARQKSVEMERKSREFEINMLQAQITPHFLYNTLRTVQVLILQQDPRAIEVIDKLITFFRSIAHLRIRKIPLREELQQVEAYISIQTVRFGQRFQVEQDLPGELLGCQVVRFCLQPLVENAINHGMSTIESGGRISIVACVEDGELHLIVSDNGCGMSSSDMATLRRKLDNAEYDSHIGILNVHQRIQLTFGNEYGIRVEHNEPAGMLVILRFPQEKHAVQPIPRPDGRS